MFVCLYVKVTNDFVLLYILVATPHYEQETVLPRLASIAAEAHEWECPALNLDAAPSSLRSDPLASDFVPAATALCAFEICPREIYTINFTQCGGPGGGRVALYSYSDGQPLAEGICGETLYVDNAGFSSCRLVTMYQTCIVPTSDLNTSSSCSGGIVLLRVETLPEVNFSFPGLSPGESVNFEISGLTANEGYLNWLQSSRSSSSLILAMFQSELLSQQTTCNFYSTGQEGGLVDYLDQVEWEGRGGTVTMPHYRLSEFISSFQVVLLARSASARVSYLGESVEVQVQQPRSSSVRLDVMYFSPGTHIVGSWGFINPSFQSEPGDAIALYQVDRDGKVIYKCIYLCDDILFIVNDHVLICVNREVQLPCP
jgi:hypothetical protein